MAAEHRHACDKVDMPTEGADILMRLSGLHQTLDLVGQSGGQLTVVISYVSPRWWNCKSSEEVRGVLMSEMHR